MKRLFCIALVIIFLEGCSSKALVNQNTKTDGTARNGADIMVKGENNGFTLHSVDFLDDNSGWIIKNRYDYISDKTDSQLLSTQDGGAHWKKIGPGNMILDKVKFTDGKTGWAISRNEDDDTTGSDTKQIQYKILSTQDGGKTQPYNGWVNMADSD